MRIERYLLLAVVSLALLSVASMVMDDRDASDVVIEITNVEYDEDQCTLSFEGRANCKLINVRVLSAGYNSPITACVIKDSTFSDSIYLGEMEPGTYRLEASYATNVVTYEFEIGESGISVTYASYDAQTGMFHIRGTASSPLVNVRVYSDSYSSVIDACVVKGGSFEDSVYLGPLEAGSYHVEVVGESGRLVKSLVVVDEQGGDPYAEDSTYSDDGKTLIEYRGTVSEYVLPLQIESIADGAFDKARIGTFVYTKDVAWDIKVKNDTFPMQKASISHLVIEEGVSTIPDYLFACLDIEELSIPASVESIGVKSFYLCPNLKTVEIAPNSNLESIGAYAFSNNQSLETVRFNSSAEGSECVIGEGAFFACGDTTIRVSSEFSLVEIGIYAFARDLSRNCQITMLIDDESGSMIHIPGTVAKMGKGAFSRAPTVYGYEPGKNTVHNRDAAPVAADTEAWKSGATGRSIVFEPNDLLTVIPEQCFSTVFVDSIDLGGCSALVEIKINAFAYCLDTGSGDDLLLPGNLEIIGPAAFRCRGTTDYSSDAAMVIPASVTRIDARALQGICQHISFQEGSKLEYFAGSTSMSVYGSIDFSNCSELSTLDSIWQGINETVLPSGMFYIMKNSAVNEETILTPVAMMRGGILEIDGDDRAILCRDPESLSEIRCDPSNTTFSYVDGILYFHDGDAAKVLLTSASKTVRLSDAGTQGIEVSQVAVGPSVVSLHLGAENILMDGAILTHADNLKTVYLNGVPSSWSIQEAFAGVKQGVTYYVPATLDAGDLDFLRGLGSVHLGYSVGEATFYCPTDYNGHTVTLDDVRVSGGAMSATISIDGCNIEDLDLLLIYGRLTAESGRIVIDSISQSTNVAFLRIDGVAPSDEAFHVTFDDGAGTVVVVSVRAGSQLSKGQIPSFTKDRHDLAGWKTSEGSEFDLSTRINRDTVLHPMWAERAPRVVVDQTAAMIMLDGVPVNGYVISDQTLRFTAAPRPGFEIGKWVVNGEEVSDATAPLEIAFQSDSTISVSYRYYSQSTGMNNVNNTDMPTADEILDLVHAYTIGGYVNTHGMVWSGMTSVPLIVDGYVYVRIADKIYKAESDTGYIVKSAASGSIEAFYHCLGYGDGYIIDYNTSKVFDLDLNQLYVLGRSIESADYYDGRFYVLGDTVYSFDPKDEDPSRADEVKGLTVIGHTDGMYGQYGVYAHEFVDGYVYYMTHHGDRRGLGAMDLSDGSTSDLDLKSLEYMFLDDGWLTYYGGYLFVAAYSDGLFGATAASHGSRLAYVPVSGLEFGEEKYYEFYGKSFSSRLAVYDGRAFVAIAGILHVFDLPEDLRDLDLGALTHRSTTLICGHGNFVLDVSHISEEGAPIYAYGIPYDTHQGATFWIAEDRAGQLTSVSTEATEREWNSQAVRSDLDGRMIWYNDTGWLYSYTTSDKNVYFFFIEDGDSAVWYEAYGATAADALASLGGDVATLNAARIVKTVNGHSVDDGMTLQMLKATYGTKDNNGEFNNLDQYSWVTIPNLGDASYSLNHYFRIICGNGSAVSAGDAFTYLDGGEAKTYAFADNIGDRNIIGKQLSRGTDVVYLRFTEDGTEIPGTMSAVKKGSEAKIHFPEVVRVGYVPVWKDSSDMEVSDIYGMAFSADATFRLSWQEIPASYLVGGSMATDGGSTRWTATVSIKSGIGDVTGLDVVATAITSDGTVLQDAGKVSNGEVSGDFGSSDISMVFIRIVDEHIGGNLGYTVLKKEATA